jgi:HK97 family phage major capsid protein
MPEQLANQLIKAIDDDVFIRGLATKFQVPNAQSLGAPSLDNDPADADWTTELSTGSEDSTMSFGKRKLEPHAFAKRIKISNDLLRSGMMNPEQLVLSRLAYKFGITEEKGFMLGNGSGQPLGLFTASADGISTGRDVSTDNTTTAITFDGLLNAFYSVKSAYQRNGSWLFHRDAIKMIAKLKDGNGQYIWNASVVEGRPDTIQSRPVFSSEYVPNTFTTGLYVGMYGDFSNYWIADAMDLQIQRLDELYAETNQIGFIGRAAADGMPVLEEAFARIALA